MPDLSTTELAPTSGASADAHQHHGHHDPAAPAGHGADHHHHGDPENDSDHPLWRSDRILLVSAGIDIGSATSQVVISEIELRRRGDSPSSRFVVTSQEIRHRSEVHLTPFTTDLTIDEERLSAIIDGEFAASGLDPKDVDTGAVILTGEAARRKNAKAIAELLAARSGAFVCATAGHHMECVLAAHGSGSVELSGRRGIRVLNIDIGGGTTKLSLVEAGVVKRTGALHIGGRLAAVDSDGRLARLEPQGQSIADRLGFSWSLGDDVSREAFDTCAAWMVSAILEAVSPEPGPEVRDLFLTDLIDLDGGYDTIIFSGGVGDYVHGVQDEWFGDFGQSLGTEIRRRLDEFPAPVTPGRGDIRSTVVGASQHSVQVSGNTIYVSDPEILPRRGLQIVAPDIDLGGPLLASDVAAAVTKRLVELEFEQTDNIALALRWRGAAPYRRLEALADGIGEAFADRIAAGLPIFLVVEGDVARTLGAIVREDKHWPVPVVAVDGISLSELEFLDIGAIMPESRTVPITIRSLVFEM